MNDDRETIALNTTHLGGYVNKPTYLKVETMAWTCWLAPENTVYADLIEPWRALTHT